MIMISIRGWYRQIEPLLRRSSKVTYSDFEFFLGNCKESARDWDDRYSNLQLGPVMSF